MLSVFCFLEGGGFSPILCSIYKLSDNTPIFMASNKSVDIIFYVFQL